MDVTTLEAFAINALKKKTNVKLFKQQRRRHRLRLALLERLNHPPADRGILCELPGRASSGPLTPSPDCLQHVGDLDLLLVAQHEAVLVRRLVCGEVIVVIPCIADRGLSSDHRGRGQLENGAGCCGPSEGGRATFNWLSWVVIRLFCKERWRLGVVIAPTAGEGVSLGQRPLEMATLSMPSALEVCCDTTPPKTDSLAGWGKGAGRFPPRVGSALAWKTPWFPNFCLISRSSCSRFRRSSVEAYFLSPPRPGGLPLGREKKISVDN